MQLRILGGIIISVLALTASGCHGHKGIVHRVESGETLTQLAHVYGVTLPELLSANPQLKSDELKEGEKILVPGAEGKRTVSRTVWDMEEVQTAEEETPKEEKVTPGQASAKPSIVPEAATSHPVVISMKSRNVPMSSKSSLVFAWPATGAVISKFGMRNQKMHNGIDIRLSPGGNILSTAEGKVVYVGNDVEGYGNMLIVRHPTNLFSVYAYVGSILAKKGADVKRGTVIAKAKNNPQEAFLHFELRRGKRALNPLAVLPR